MSAKQLESMSPSPRPFLKWAGGKRQLLPELLKRVPAKFNTYYEPFLGAGALFFCLYGPSTRGSSTQGSSTQGSSTQGSSTWPKHAVLSDANEELILSYRGLRDDPASVVQHLRTMERAHTSDPRKTFEYTRAVDISGHTRPYIAARMIYLNKTCFNGLYRVNRKGLFNVPMGKFKTTPVICDEINLIACSSVLGSDYGGESLVELDTMDFKLALERPRAGDFVYLDPPYIPRSDTSNFTSFTPGGFDSGDQADLAKIARRLKEKGVHILLSNSGTKEVRDLYPEPFFKLEEVAGRRNINSRWEGRDAVVEYLIS